MSSIPGTVRFAVLSAKPSAPPAGYCIIYFKNDNILYCQDSSGTEIQVEVPSDVNPNPDTIVLRDGDGNIRALFIDDQTGLSSIDVSNRELYDGLGNQIASWSSGFNVDTSPSGGSIHLQTSSAQFNLSSAGTALIAGVNASNFQIESDGLIKMTGSGSTIQFNADGSGSLGTASDLTLFSNEEATVLHLNMDGTINLQSNEFGQNLEYDPSGNVFLSNPYGSALILTSTHAAILGTSNGLFTIDPNGNFLLSDNSSAIGLSSPSSNTLLVATTDSGNGSSVDAFGNSSIGFGRALNGSAININSDCVLGGGYADQTSIIEVGGSGSINISYVTGNSTTQSDALGTAIFAYASTDGCYVSTGASGTMIQVYASNGSSAQAHGQGSALFVYVDGSGTNAQTHAIGAHIMGAAIANGSFSVQGRGGFAGGFADSTIPSSGSTVNTFGDAGFSFGLSNFGNGIFASGDAAQAWGDDGHGAQIAGGLSSGVWGSGNSTAFDYTYLFGIALSTSNANNFQIGWGFPLLEVDGADGTLINDTSNVAAANFNLRQLTSSSGNAVYNWDYGFIGNPDTGSQVIGFHAGIVTIDDSAGNESADFDARTSYDITGTDSIHWNNRQLLANDGGTTVLDWSSTTGVALSGTPTAPTAALGTNTTQLATTAFVEAAFTFTTGLTNTAGVVTVNNIQNIGRLSNLTSNGYVTTNSGNGTLGVSTGIPIGINLFNYYNFS